MACTLAASKSQSEKATVASEDLHIFFADSKQFLPLMAKHATVCLQFLICLGWPSEISIERVSKISEKSKSNLRLHRLFRETTYAAAFYFHSGSSFRANKKKSKFYCQGNVEIHFGQDSD